MYRYTKLVTTILALFGGAAAYAECTPPEPPASLPDGSMATYEEMVDAHGAVRTFDSDIRSFIVCLELEIKTLLDDPSIDDATKDDLRALLVGRTDAAVDEAEFVVDQFNQQLRIFRERDAQ